MQHQRQNHMRERTSRERHTSGSKISKGLQSIKYSLLQYPKNPNIGPGAQTTKKWKGGTL